jgi:hypothetical protein
MRDGPASATHDTMPDHPVFVQLLELIEESRRGAAAAPSVGPFAGYKGTTIQPYVIEHGRPFTGIKLPKGYRRRAEKQCFFNAGMLAMESRGTYVEGYAIRRANILIHHAWITVDNVHAIDVTWTHPEQSGYFGVPIPSTVLAKIMCKWDELLSPLERIVFGK